MKLGQLRIGQGGLSTDVASASDQRVPQIAHNGARRQAHLLNLAEEVLELVQVEASPAVRGEERHLLEQLLDLDSSLELLHKALERDKVEVADMIRVGVLRICRNDLLGQ